MKWPKRISKAIAKQNTTKIQLHDRLYGHWPSRIYSGYTKFLAYIL